MFITAHGSGRSRAGRQHVSIDEAFLTARTPSAVSAFVDADTVAKKDVVIVLANVQAFCVEDDITLTAARDGSLPGRDRQGALSAHTHLLLAREHESMRLPSFSAQR